jgi:hypothetical protein
MMHPHATVTATTGEQLNREAMFGNTGKYS